MHIKSMVIDGFKSYGQRTEINGFDALFNAITGLNGSGKSNILDAICFLLGITNLSQVRATNLQELVYKNGQAGITKASVSITFYNKDKREGQCPVGYESYDEITVTRQVVVGGKNKYLINGSNAQNQRVQDLFRSIQLNVNNPHFLIMQGRITKVLNMKPPEILAMIEEAVGTRMYETKKQQAEKTIDKKDNKLREINNLLTDEINPTLGKLRSERSAYLEFQKIQRELEHLTKLYVAYQFVTAEESSLRAKEDLEDVSKKLADLEAAVKSGVEELEALAQRVQRLERQRDEELGGRLKELEAEQKEAEKTAMKAESSLKAVKDSKRQEGKKQDQIKREMTKDEKALEEKSSTQGSMQAEFDKLRAEATSCFEKLEAARKRFEQISLGKFSDAEGGAAATLQEQLIRTKEELSKKQTEIKAADGKLKHSEAEIKKKRQQMEKTKGEYQKDTANLTKYEKDVDRAQAEMSRLNYEDGTLERLEDRHRQLKHEANAMRQRVQGMEAQLAWLELQYRDPERGWDHGQVHGAVAGLMKVKDERYFAAIDAAGAGGLRQIVVATADAAAKIFNQGQLKSRVTFLPLDKVRSYSVDERTLERARALVQASGAQVWRALDLIDYDPVNRTAMESVFGSTLICSTMDAAKRLAYAPGVGKNCVTLDGDVCNPSGEMSGGAADKRGSTTARVMSLREAQAALQAKAGEAEAANAEFKQIANVAQRFAKLKQDFELKEHELGLIKQRLENTAHHRLVEEIGQLDAEMTAIKDGVTDAKKTEADAAKKVKELEYKMKNSKQLKEKELKEADAEVKKFQKAEQASKDKWTAKEAQEQSLKMEIADLEKSLADARQQVKASDEALVGYDAEISRLEEETNAAKNAVKSAKDGVKAQKEVLNSHNKEINKEGEKKEKIKKANQDRELEMQQMRHTITKATDEAASAEKAVRHMLAKHEWIADDRKFFGQPNTAYDFKAQDPKEAGRRKHQLEEKKEKLEKTVNMRAMNMLGKAEEQFNDLMRKKNTVEQDKAKIIKVIEELDVKKRAELRRAWDKVNKDFGSIFSSLLPGSKAKLEPPEGKKDVLDGLEVRVAFGDVWKDSLTELSGGQRSLVALSLILSLLLFRPAPLYILDEVDAALDLSHTQNIGHMLKTHFQSSQFIVVSLKDGMFNNANVLYRTKFVDGMSTVSRTAQQSHVTGQNKRS